MRSPDTTTDVAACLARISVLEDERRAALLAGCDSADGVTVRAITARQQADALAFARRGAS
jgi:hypothetical protein